MGKERIGGGTVLTIILAVLIVGLTICGTILCFIPESTNTKTLTILHTWEEGGQYYFSDELGYVYHIACKGNLWKPDGGIRYDDMPKIRFEKLKVGQRYHVEYVVRQRDVRLSLGEEELET